jgi:GTP-binding protein
VINEVFDLFAALDATDEQLDFPILYGSGKQGWMAMIAGRSAGPGPGAAVRPHPEHVPEPKVEDGPFRMLGTLLEANPFLGRIITGRITSGSGEAEPDRSRCSPATARPSRPAASPRSSPSAASSASRSRRRRRRHRLDRGPGEGTVADTFCDPSVDTPIQAQPIDPPTVSMTFIVNDSPLAGTEGDKVTSRVIRDRLFKEAEGNVALKIEESPTTRTASSSPAAANCSSPS